MKIIMLNKKKGNNELKQLTKRQFKGNNVWGILKYYVKTTNVTAYTLAFTFNSAQKNITILVENVPVNNLL